MIFYVYLFWPDEYDFYSYIVVFFVSILMRRLCLAFHYFYKINTKLIYN